MNTSPITVPEGALLNLIERLGRLAWRKYQQRYPLVWIDGEFVTVDYSGFPPFISFRFENEDAKLMTRLKMAVESYEGAVAWVLDEHKRIALPGTNWIICPKRLREIQPAALKANKSAGEYMAEYESSFGPVAYEDLTILTAYLCNIVLPTADTSPDTV